MCPFISDVTYPSSSHMQCDREINAFVAGDRHLGVASCSGSWEPDALAYRASLVPGTAWARSGNSSECQWQISRRRKASEMRAAVL